jgi:FHA domain
MFELLLTRSGSKMAAAAGDLADQAGLKTAQVLRLLDQLVRPEYRILRVSVPHPDRVRQRYEIMHDRLADAILKWRARTLAEARKDADAVVSKRLSAVPAWDRWAVAEVVRLRACQPDKGEVSLKEASDHLGIAGERLLTVLRSFTKAAGFLTCSGCGDDTRIGVIDPFFGEALTGWLGQFENNRPFGCLIDLRDGSVIELVGGGELLGRAFHEHLRESFISRAHLLIMRPDRPDGDSTLLDLRSLNGTTLNAKPLNYGQFPELASNDVVILANVMPLIFIAASKFPELAGSESRWREELRLPAPSEDISGVVVSGMTRDYITLRSGEVYIYQDGTISTDERPSERSDVLIKLTPMKGRGIKVSFGDRVTDARHVNRERYQYYTDQLDPNESYLVQSDAPEKEDEGSDPEGFVSIFGRLQVNESFFEIVAC